MFLYISMEVWSRVWYMQLVQLSDVGVIKATQLPILILHLCKSSPHTHGFHVHGFSPSHQILSCQHQQMWDPPDTKGVDSTCIILYEGLEHPEILVSEGHTGTCLSWTPRDKSIPSKIYCKTNLVTQLLTHFLAL